MSFLDNPYKWADKSEFILSPAGKQFVKEELQYIAETTHEVMSEVYKETVSPIEDIEQFELRLDCTNGPVSSISELWLFRHKDFPELFSVRGEICFKFETTAGSTFSSVENELCTFEKQCLQELKSFLTVDERSAHEALGSCTGTFITYLQYGVDLDARYCGIRVPFQIEISNQSGRYVIPTPPKKRGRPPKNKVSEK